METRTHTAPEKLNVLTAKLKFWLLDLLLWLSEWMGRALPRAWRIEMRAALRQALQGARVIVFLRAVVQCESAKQTHIESPHSAPRGCRYRGVLDNDMRNVCRTVRLRGRTLAARLAELRDVLDNLDVWIARAVKRLRGGAHGARYVLTASVSARLRALTHVDAYVADSS